MSFKDNDPNTKKQLAQFSVDEWIEFRERLERLNNAGELIERDYRLLREIIVNQRTTAELAYLGRTDSNFNWLVSNRNKPMSTRRVQQILTEYFPEFHIQTTHKQNRKHQKLRTEQNNIRQTMITEFSCCAKCGSKENLQLHHMIPVLIGGDNDDDNLIILCKKCHFRVTVHNRDILHDITPLISLQG